MTPKEVQELATRIYESEVAKKFIQRQDGSYYVSHMTLESLAAIAVEAAQVFQKTLDAS